MTLDDGVGFRIPAGSVLVLQIHYVTTGKAEKCRISVGLKYARGTVDQQLRFHLLVDNAVRDPARSPRPTPSRPAATLDRDAIGSACSPTCTCAAGT